MIRNTDSFGEEIIQENLLTSKKYFTLYSGNSIGFCYAVF